MAGLLGVFAMLLIATLYSLGAKVEAVEEVLKEREKIAQTIRERLEDEPNVDVDETGSITFSGDVLFAPGKDSLSPHGKQLLSEVMPKYLDALLNDQQVVNELEQIVIVGHADTTNSYRYNLGLSQDRAARVMEHLLDDFGLQEFRSDLRKYSVASGRSEMDLIIRQDKTVDMDRSRRIEIQFRLKDKELVERVMLELRRVLGVDAE